MEVGDVLSSITGSSGGVLGSILAFLTAAAVVYRKYIRSEKVEGAESGSKVDQIARLQDLLDKADARADKADERATEANKRTDIAFDERNKLFERIGLMASEMEGMRSQIETLTREVTQLRKQINEQGH